MVVWRAIYHDASTGLFEIFEALVGMKVESLGIRSSGKEAGEGGDGVDLASEPVDVCLVSEARW